MHEHVFTHITAVLTYYSCSNKSEQLEQYVNYHNCLWWLLNSEIEDCDGYITQ